MIRRLVFRRSLFVMSLTQLPFEAPPTISNFLSILSSQSDDHRHKHVHFGNEAADADSLVAPLCYAFLAQQESSDFCHVPLLSIPRAELCMRPETLLLFRLAGIIPSSLLHFDDPGLLDDVSLAPFARVTLLDHNALAPKLRARWPQLEFRVCELIDHHHDSALYPTALRDVAFAEGRALVGSACTLVAERFLVHRAAEALLADGAVATLLSGVILLDTLDMDPVAAKGTARDAAALDALLPRVSVGRRELFTQLQNAKLDPSWWTELNVAQCLGYDYKQGEAAGGVAFGMSSVLVSIEALTSKPGFSAAVSAFMAERGISVLAVMALVVSPEGQRSREFLLASNDVAATAALVERSGMAAALNLRPLESPVPWTPLSQSASLKMEGKVEFAAYAQGALASSRKQAMPLLDASLANSVSSAL